MKRIILTIAVSIIVLSTSGQENYSVSYIKNEIGIHAGATTGLGMSYRRWFGKAGIQLTGLPIKTDNTEVYSLSLTALYTFYDAKYIRIFGYLGNHYFIDREDGDEQIWKKLHIGNNDRSYDYYNDESHYDHSSYNIGFGPGFAFGNIVRFNLMIGYGLYDVLDSFNMYPSGEIGVYYRF